jgi:hypothetical protein
MNLPFTKKTRRRAGALAMVSALALAASACQAQRINQDVFVSYDGSAVYSEQINEFDAPGQARDGYEHIWNDINTTCVTALNEDEDEGTVGSWGTVGSSTNATQANDSNPSTVEHVYLTSLGTVPSEDTVNCFMNEVLDDPESETDNESLVCGDTNTANDCQDPDGGGMGTYEILNDESDFYQAALATDGGTPSYAFAEHTVVLIRDYFNAVPSCDTDSNPSTPNATGVAGCITDPQGGGAGPVGCIIARMDSSWLTTKPDDGNLEWRRVCEQ